MVVPFLEKELQQVVYEYLPAYDIQYKWESMSLNMILQAPKIFRTFRKEHRVFSALVKKYKPVACISDNRYGCYHPKVPCFFMGHQWNILTNQGNIHSIASRVNQFFISNFHALLIPDDETVCLSGALTDPINGIKKYYLGILSRFGAEQEHEIDKVFESMIVLSGPEPTRSQLEEKLCNYFGARAQNNYILIRGTNSEPKHNIPTNILVFNIAHKEEIISFSRQSNVLICRSGYSSIMDYGSLKINHLLFIPTKGQTEQSYLARYCQEKFNIPFIREDEISGQSLSEALELAKNENQLGKMIEFASSSLESSWTSIQRDFDIL